MKKIKNFIRYIIYIYKQNKNIKAPIKNKLYASIHGFTINEYYLYGLNKNNIKEYVPEFIRILKRHNMSNEFHSILDNKLIFKQLFQEKMPLAKTIAYKLDKSYYNNSNEPIDISEIISYLKMKKCIVKPLTLGGGNKIAKIDCSKNNYLVDGKEKNKEEFMQFIESYNDFIIEELTPNGKYSDEVYKQSTNTIRIITAKNLQNKIECYKIIHRFGTNKSKPTDNFSRGGIACEIDLKTFKMQHGHSKYNRQPLKYHPDTNVKFSSINIPNLNEIIQNLIKFHQNINFLNFIAWDVVIQDNGFTIIEANNSSGFDLGQIESGIRTQKINEIMTKYGVYK